MRKIFYLKLFFSNAMVAEYILGLKVKFYLSENDGRNNSLLMNFKTKIMTKIMRSYCIDIIKVKNSSNLTINDDKSINLNKIIITQSEPLEYQSHPFCLFSM